MEDESLGPRLWRTSLGIKILVSFPDLNLGRQTSVGSGTEATVLCAVHVCTCSVLARDDLKERFFLRDQCIAVVYIFSKENGIFKSGAAPLFHSLARTLVHVIDVYSFTFATSSSR